LPDNPVGGVRTLSGVMGYDVHQVDTPSAPESLLVEMADYYVMVEAEEMPGDPPTPHEVQIEQWRHVESRYPVPRWILRDDDGIAAAAVAYYSLDQNLENGFGRVHVHPGKRGRGYARAIASPLLDHLENAGRHRFDTWVKDGDPAEKLVEKLGLKKVYSDRRSRLNIADLDMDMMRSWIERASERASDYELVYYLSPIPADLVEPYCELRDVMNTAPREDFEAEDEVMTPEEWREREQNVIDSKCQLHTLIAVHKPTGELAGYTQIKTQDRQPDLAWQWDTGVVPAHRNKGLGRWLKAAMIERKVKSYPALRRVDTYNAGSNEQMLNINVSMGFKQVHLSHAWQGELATVRERFGA
jgi:mycothiol synthase